MKIKEYIKYLDKLAKKYPDLMVITSSDDEGNYFNEVYYAPTEGVFKDGEFKPLEKGEKLTVLNAICLN